MLELIEYVTLIGLIALFSAVFSLLFVIIAFFFRSKQQENAINALQEVNEAQRAEFASQRGRLLGNSSAEKKAARAERLEALMGEAITIFQKGNGVDLQKEGLALISKYPDVAGYYAKKQMGL